MRNTNNSTFRKGKNVEPRNDRLVCLTLILGTVMEH